MYYAHKCTYCLRIYYIYHTNKTEAARLLYDGIKKHLIDYDEDRKEYEMDSSPDREANEMYIEMTEMNEPPSGAYKL